MNHSSGKCVDLIICDCISIFSIHRVEVLYFIVGAIGKNGVEAFEKHYICFVRWQVQHIVRSDSRHAGNFHQFYALSRSRLRQSTLWLSTMILMPEDLLQGRPSHLIEESACSVCYLLAMQNGGSCNLSICLGDQAAIHL